MSAHLPQAFTQAPGRARLPTMKGTFFSHSPVGGSE